MRTTDDGGGREAANVIAAATDTANERPPVNHKDEPGSRARKRPRHELGRRAFMRLLGAGVGIALMPREQFLPGLGRATVNASSLLEPTILASDVYPIGVWSPPPPSETTVERYAEIAAAGFTFVHGGNGVNNPDINRQALTAAAANHLEVIVSDPRITRLARPKARTSQQDALVAVGTTAADYRAYPSFAGFLLTDEPNASQFGNLRALTDAVRQLTPDALPFVNLWPYTSSDNLGAPSYDAYLQEYGEQVRPSLLSFDHYPLILDAQGQKALTKQYFNNWALIRAHALQLGAPAWVFIQSIGFEFLTIPLPPRRTPDEAELLWQVNVSLAYGAKGIQYFTYWTPTQDGVAFQDALITPQGSRTPLYDAATRVNRYLKVVGKVLLPLVSESVTHAGETDLPIGAEAFAGDAYVASTSGSPVILGRFRPADGDTNPRYLLVVNRSSDGTAETTLALTGAVSKVFALDARGTFVPVNTPGPPGSRTIQVRLDPGAAKLYRLQTNQRPS